MGLHRIAMTCHRCPHQAYLGEQRDALRCPVAKFVNLNKDVYLLEVPAALEKRAPAGFEKCSMTKDVVRFTSVALEALKADMAAADEANEAALQVSEAAFEPPATCGFDSPSNGGYVGRAFSRGSWRRSVRAEPRGARRWRRRRSSTYWRRWQWRRTATRTAPCACPLCCRCHVMERRCGRHTGYGTRVREVAVRWAPRSFPMTRRWAGKRRRCCCSRGPTWVANPLCCARFACPLSWRSWARSCPRRP